MSKWSRLLGSTKKLWMRGVGWFAPQRQLMCAWNALNPKTSFLPLFGALIAVLILLQINGYIGTELFSSAVLAATAYVLGKHIAIKTSRYNTLCNLEVELNEALDALGSNVQTMEKLKNIGMPIFIAPTRVSFDGSLVKDVGRLDLKNALLIVMGSLRRVAHDLEHVSTQSRESMDALITNSAGRAEALRTLGEISNYCKKTFEEIKNCLVMTRVYLRLDRPRIVLTLQSYIDPRSFDEECKKAKERLEAEMKEIGELA